VRTSTEFERDRDLEEDTAGGDAGVGRGRCFGTTAIFDGERGADGRRHARVSGDGRR
jgi:hypothetical protein